MPYEPGKCTYFEDPATLGRQQLFACLTCQSKDPQSTANVICYSCSIQCHSDHDLCELFTKRNLSCDCGTTRMKSFGGCNLRKNFDALDDPQNEDQVYKCHNFGGKFCGCDQKYNAEAEKGTMLQCLLGDVCGEDWFHEECILGLRHGSVYAQKAEAEDEPKAEDKEEEKKKEPTAVVYPEGVNMFDQIDSAAADHIKAPDDHSNHPDADNENDDEEEEEDDDEDCQTLEGLPNLNQFDSYVCWQCIDKHKAFFLRLLEMDHSKICLDPVLNGKFESLEERNLFIEALKNSKKRKADVNEEPEKRVKLETETAAPEDTSDKPEPTTDTNTDTDSPSYLKSHPFSLFLLPDFRASLSTLTQAHPSPVSTSFLTQFPFFLTEENTYEPPPDDDATSSLLDAGAKALSSIPRQQALQGLQAYSMIKQRLSDFFKPFAETGKVVTETDVVGFFEQVKSERRLS